jgi:hypothetical protein
MTNPAEVKELIDEVLEEQALAIGGLAADYGMEDRVIRGLIKSLSSIRDRAIRRLDEEQVPHPAIVEFLARLGRDPRLHEP